MLFNKIKHTNNVITGCARGLGKATLELFLKMESGPILGIDNFFDKDFEKSLNLTERQREKLMLKQQNTFEDEVEKSFEEFVSKHKTIDHVVNTAGIALAYPIYWKNGRSYSMSNAYDLINFNTYGTFNVTRLASKYMIDESINENEPKSKCIINVSCLSTKLPCLGQTFYAASKGALESATLCIARELAPFNIRCNTIGVGYFDTDLIRASEVGLEQHINESSLAPNRLGRPDEFAHLVQVIIENQMLNGSCIRFWTNFKEMIDQAKSRDQDIVTEPLGRGAFHDNLLKSSRDLRTFDSAKAQKALTQMFPNYGLTSRGGLMLSIALQNDKTRNKSKTHVSDKPKHAFDLSRSYTFGEGKKSCQKKEVIFSDPIVTNEYIYEPTLVPVFKDPTSSLSDCDETEFAKIMEEVLRRKISIRNKKTNQRLARRRNNPVPPDMVSSNLDDSNKDHSKSPKKTTPDNSSLFKSPKKRPYETSPACKDTEESLFSSPKIAKVTPYFSNLQSDQSNHNEDKVDKNSKIHEIVVDQNNCNECIMNPKTDSGDEETWEEALPIEQTGDISTKLDNSLDIVPQQTSYLNWIAFGLRFLSNQVNKYMS